jgi:hypothetical protein
MTLTKLEVEYIEARQHSKNLRELKKTKEFTDIMKKYFPSFKTKAEGGKPHSRNFILCNVLFHNSNGDMVIPFGSKHGGQEPYVLCPRCGGIWSPYDWGNPLIGYINPDEESISTFLTKEGN